jgi:predicted Fe-Mo cluster-binding NifX family protein
MVFDGETWNCIENTQGAKAAHGAGTGAAQLLLDAGVTVLVTRDCGPKASDVLSAGGMEVHTGFRGTATQAADFVTAQDRGRRTIIAVPVENGKLASHFGHCAHFDLMELDNEKQDIISRSRVEAPPHEPGLLPGWLAERGVTLVIAGGMGSRAQTLFAQHGLELVLGAPQDEPESLARRFLAGTLVAGANQCDH